MKTLLTLTLAGTLVLAAAPPARKVPNMFRAQPGPDAEILARTDRYVLNADGSVVHERSERVRLNTYVVINRLLGETSVDWDPAQETCEVLHDRTVLPSGEVVPAPANAVLDDQPAAAHGNPLWARLRRRVLVHTGLVPGAVTESAWRITRKAGGPPSLTVAEPLTFAFPAKDRVVEVDVPAAVAFLLPAGSPATVQEAGGRRLFRFHGSDIPALPSEPGAPSRLELDRWALVSAGQPAQPRGASAEWTRRVAAAGQAPADAVALARKAAAASPDRERQLLAALDRLREALNVSPELDTTRTGGAIQPLEAVWNAGWATPLELATLEAKVLGELGFQAWPGLLQSGPRAALPAPGFALHERAVLLVRLEAGDDRLYDPRSAATEKPLELSAGPSHLVLPEAAGEARLPAPGPWRRRLAVNLRPDAKGGLQGELSLEASGAATPHADLVRDAQKFADALASRCFKGAHARDVKVTRLDRGRAAITASLEGALADQDALGFASLALPAAFEAWPADPGAARQSPVALAGPGEETLELTVVLPKGWQVAAAPAAAQVANALGAVAVTGRSWREGENAAAAVTRRLTFSAPLAAAGDALKVRALAAAAAAPDAQGFILRAPK